MNFNQLVNEYKKDCDFVSIRVVDQKNRFIMARNGAPENISLGSTKGVMIEVLIDGQFAYACTDRIDLDSLNNCFKKAKSLALHAKELGITSYESSMRGSSGGSYQTKNVSSLDSHSISEIQKRLIKASKELKASDKIINTQAFAQYSHTHTMLLNSNGLEVDQTFDQIGYDLSSTASEGSESQTRSLGMMNAQAGYEKLDETFLSKESERIGKEALELLNAEECPSGVYDIMLAPDQLYLQIHESIGHPLEIDRIIGDERNYAGWSFVSPSDFGSLQYGSEKLNVTFDPSLEGELASYAFDDLGMKAQKEYVIKDGKLLRGLGSVESQKRSGIPGVACARATSWNRAPIDRMANLNIEPGNSSFDEMVSSIEKGVLMRTNRSWSIDDYRNKFQFGCEYGQLIEDGKITKTVKNPNYRGVSTPFWNSLKKVGDESTFEVWGSFYCGKGEPNQIIRVGHATPMCLFENIEVFGGHQ